MSNSYVLGIAVGIAFGIMLVAFIFSYLKKKGKDICEYDERQKLAQLKGWKAAFIAAVDIFGPWASMITMSCCSLFIGVGAYGIVCIIKDAYTPLHKRAGRYMLLFLVIAAFNAVTGIMNCKRIGFFDEGRLTVGWINLFAAALLIIIDIVYAIDVIIKRSRAVEPDEED